MARRAPYLELVQPDEPPARVQAARSAMAHDAPDDDPIRGMQMLVFAFLWCASVVAAGVITALAGLWP
jgi:hypothetical protein